MMFIPALIELLEMNYDVWANNNVIAGVQHLPRIRGDRCCHNLHCLLCAQRVLFGRRHYRRGIIIKQRNSTG